MEQVLRGEAIGGQGAKGLGINYFIAILISKCSFILVPLQVGNIRQYAGHSYLVLVVRDWMLHIGDWIPRLAEASLFKKSNLLLIRETLSPVRDS